jgi:hypothetical protein
VQVLPIGPSHTPPNLLSIDIKPVHEEGTDGPVVFIDGFLFYANGFVVDHGGQGLFGALPERLAAFGRIDLCQPDFDLLVSRG